MTPKARGAMPAKKRILHVAYFESLLQLRTSMLEKSGYVVRSVQGNIKAMDVPTEDMADIDLVVIGFSGTYGARAAMLGWFKQNYPAIPVVVLQANTSERFDGADAVTLSEDPRVWLGAVSRCLTAQ